MSRLTLRIQPSGRLVVMLYLGVGTILRAALTQTGQQVPGLIQVQALIDTGASRTVVEEGKLATLGLYPVGETSVHTASTGATAVRRNVYNIEVSLAETVTGTLANDLDVVAADDLTGLGVEALLGRDILRRLYFEYNGPTDEFTLEL